MTQKNNPTKILTLHRGPSTAQGTFSRLQYNNQHICYMVELPDRQNRSNISRIPAGRYVVTHMPRSASGKYKNVYHVQNVPKRFGVLIHAGNFAGDKSMGFKTHSWGCLLPATRLGKLNGQRAGLASRGALKAIHRIVQQQTFLLEIV